MKIEKDRAPQRYTLHNELKLQPKRKQHSKIDNKTNNKINNKKKIVNKINDQIDNKTKDNKEMKNKNIKGNTKLQNLQNKMKNTKINNNNKNKNKSIKNNKTPSLPKKHVNAAPPSKPMVASHNKITTRHHHNHHHHHHHHNHKAHHHNHKTIRSRTRSPQNVWSDAANQDPARPFTTDEKSGTPSEAGLMNIMEVRDKEASYDRTTTNVATNLLLDYFGSGISTVNPPNTASPDMGNLITGNATFNTGGPPSCVGVAPLDNRILTNGTMVTGIVATNQNTTAAANSRNCGEGGPVEEGISTGESGIDATWDYGKRRK